LKGKVLSIPIFTLIFITVFATSALAVGQNLNNYLYVHTNEPGTHHLKDKYGNTTFQGDAVENDATFTRVVLQQQGKTSGDRVYAVFAGGQRQEITSFGSAVTLSNQNSKSISFVLEKSSTNEVYIKVVELDTYDETGGGTNVEYYLTASTPTSYGSLGDGGSGGATCTITATLNGSLLAWNVSDASNFYQVQIKKNGSHFGYMGGTTGQVDLRSVGQGTYTVSAIDMDKNILCTSNQVYYAGEGEGGDPGGGDPGGGDPGGEDPPPEDPPETGCNGCDFLAELLTCPLWELYLDDLSGAISRAIPPPPDWDYVASVMTDHIVPALGDEIDRRLGYAYYDGDPGASQPSFSQPWQTKENVPVMQDMNQRVDFKINQPGEVPEFPVEDMTPRGEDMIQIPDPLAIPNLATEDRPEPKYETTPRETDPSGDLPDPRDTTPNEDDQTKPIEPSENMPEPRDTTPTDDLTGPTPGPRDTVPEADPVAPRTTTPTGDESHPTVPGEGNARDTTPTDWASEREGGG